MSPLRVKGFTDERSILTTEGGIDHENTFDSECPHLFAVVLCGADLTDFRAYRSDFTDADLTNTNIEDGDFSEAIFCRTKTPWGVENIGRLAGF